MNKLIIGSDKSPILQDLPARFLFIDDGPLIDQLDLPKRRSVTVLDLTHHSFNPLKGMDYRKAREFVGVLNAVFPEGENTLTKATFDYQLLEALLDKPNRLDGLIKNTKDTQYAYQKIQTLMLSPVLERVLNRPTNFSFKGTIIARLDRAQLGDFDAFVLGNLLISQYLDTVVIPDFGFYACPSHISLIRENRLIAGVTSLDDVPRMRSQLLLIETKTGSHATVQDAETLASYDCSALPNTDIYKEFIENCIRAT